MTYIIVSKPECHWCQKAKELLASKNIPFREVELNNRIDKDALLALVPNATTVPQVFQYVGGYKELEEANQNNAKKASNH